MNKLSEAYKAFKSGDTEKLRSLKDETHGSAISFIIGMFIVILLALNLLPTVAQQAVTAQENNSTAAFAGTVGMISILVLLFVVLPVVIVAKATS